MWFWNRIEVYEGFSVGEFNRLRDILIQGGIKYDYRLVNRYGSSVPGVNKPGVGSLIGNRREVQYYLYVHKEDYDEAMFLMHSAGPAD